MDNKNQIFYDQKEVSHAVGVSGNVNTDFEVNTDFNFCSGIRIVEITDGDLVNNYDVGLISKDGTLMSPMNKTLLETSSAVGASDKMLPQAFRVYSGMNLRISTNMPSAVATDALNFYVQLKLEKLSEEEIQRRLNK